ncbi:hypothetical protein IFM89_027855 [Coptis chinensis]|uniref:Uncharacterized protein n=1 Tax=Coptis chinensis TaxID=261450 RepID=A0A835HHG5_9MAGN|nr:hypothetical protein IFM89_027855 [Coptis chinensis]
MVPEKIRILSTLALVALCQDRSRQAAVLITITSGGNRGILPSFIAKTIDSITAGLIPTLLPLLKDLEPQHLHLVGTLRFMFLRHLWIIATQRNAAFVRDLGVRRHYCSSQDEVCYIESGSNETGGEDSHSFGKGKQVVDVEAGRNG